MPQDHYDITKDNFNPTFLFTWKGIRTVTEAKYHCHDYLEMAIILGGEGKYHIDDEMYDVVEGDVLIFNPGVMHQSVVSNIDNPTIEFFVGFSDINFIGMEPNQLRTGAPILHASPDLKLKLFKLCTSMYAENEIPKPGRYLMLRTYLEQMLLLIIRDQAEPVERQKGYSFESIGRKYVVEQIINYFEEHYSEKISLDQIAENMYLSPFYISKIFKSETGDTPIRYLIDIRLDRGSCVTICIFSNVLICLHGLITTL